MNVLCFFLFFLENHESPDVENVVVEATAMKNIEKFDGKVMLYKKQ